jgi:uncharacterized protein (TIGR03067 family)
MAPEAFRQNRQNGVRSNAYAHRRVRIPAMKRIAILACFVLAVAIATSALFMAAHRSKMAASNRVVDPAKLIGAWTLTSGEMEGEKADPKLKEGDIQVTPSRFTIDVGGDLGQIAFSYKVDVTVDPATIDLRMLEQPSIEVLALIASDDDGFKLCGVLKQGANSGGSRPTGFFSTKDNHAILLTFRPARN